MDGARTCCSKHVRHTLVTLPVNGASERKPCLFLLPNRLRLCLACCSPPPPLCSSHRRKVSMNVTLQLHRTGTGQRLCRLKSSSRVSLFLFLQLIYFCSSANQNTSFHQLSAARLTTVSRFLLCLEKAPQKSPSSGENFSQQTHVL